MDTIFLYGKFVVISNKKKLFRGVLFFTKTATPLKLAILVCWCMIFGVLYFINLTSSINKAPQNLHAVNLSPLLGQKTILLQSILIELMVSPVFLSASTLRKLDVGMSIASIECLIMRFMIIIQEESMINRNKQNQQSMRCTNCSSTLLDRIGTEVYCLQCETVNNVIQFEMQVVPVAYQSNCRNRRQLDMERKLNAHIREFICKYGNHCQEQEIKLLREKLIKIKKMTPNSKGTREAAAVVVYCSLKEQIKLSIPDFCKQNNLKHKLFNKKYKVYDNLYNDKKGVVPEIVIQKQGNQFIKMEERNDHFDIIPKPQNDPSGQSQLSSDKLFYITYADSRKGLEIIFDDIFPNFYLKQKKQLIIQKLITKIASVPPQFFVKIQAQALSKPTQLYYLIFAIIKTLGYKINFEKYNDIIRKNAGHILRKSLAYEVKKHYDEFYKKEKEIQSESFELIQVNGIKVQANNPAPLRIRFPLADSQSQFQYEYYFQDQFYG